MDMYWWAVWLGCVLLLFIRAAFEWGMNRYGVLGLFVFITTLMYASVRHVQSLDGEVSVWGFIVLLYLPTIVGGTLIRMRENSKNRWDNLGR